jgi:phosphate transport system permease protein
MKKSFSKQKISEKLMEIVFTFSAIISILAVILISLFLFINAFPAFKEIGLFKFLSGENWSPGDVPASFGILPMILGSLYITAGAIIIGVPVGIFAAVFLAKVCPKKLYKILKPATELLAGIPSVVYGFFGMIAIVPYMGNSMLSASILLGIMILPTIITLSETALRSVPENYYEGALALGSGHYRAVFKIMLPAAKSGVFTAIVLGIGRAVGETMAVIMIAGNQPRIPNGIFEGARTLTANIVIEMGYAEGLHKQALIATGVVLFVFILIINLSLSLIKRKAK